MANPLQMLPLKSHGFQFLHEIAISAPPAKTWSALGNMKDWFGLDPDRSKWAKHKIDLRAGSPWTVEFPGGGSALFGVVTYLEPGKLVRISGQLGSTHLPVSSVLIFELQEQDGGKSTLLRMCLRCSGLMTEDVETRMNGLWAKLLPNLKALAEK